MYIKFNVFWVTSCLLGALCCFECSAAESEVKVDTEIAVLIDVSGSMKQNDPHNLRIPALKLLLNVLPEHVRAGIWLFSEKTSVLVPVGQVDAEWKKQAVEAISLVNSSGLFTNIEEALTLATADWKTKNANVSRNVVLLTDGMIDVAKDSALNQASKDRVIKELLPKLQQSGVQLQTIALSSNADTPLLKKLASATQGWSETVASAEQLERIFLKMFKQTVPQETVPIQGNTFKIDSSIKEFSVLVFRKSDAITELLSPDKQRISRGTKSKSVHWLSEHNYDLMTIREPAAGEWQIIADRDPDNQVMIVTDLKFALDALPLYKMPLDPLKFQAHFTDKAVLLERDDFLKLINITVKMSDGVNEFPDILLHPSSSTKGYFEAVMDQPLVPGTYMLRVVADGKTFTREVTHSLAIKDALITVNSEVNKEKNQVTVILTPDPKIVDTHTLSLQAQLNMQGKEAITVDIPKKGERWELAIDAPEKNQQMIVNFTATAKTANGHDITPELQPLVIDGEASESEHSKEAVDGVELHKTEEHESVKDVKAAPEKTEESAADAPPQGLHDEKAIAPSEVPQNSFDWKMSTLIVLTINLLLSGVGYFLWRFLKRRATKKQEQLLSRLS